MVTLSLVTATAPPEPLHESARNANYDIQVRLDVEQRMLIGSQTLEWTNITDRETDEMWFHLYWNGWRNDRSTWMKGDRIRDRSDLSGDVRESDWSWIEVDRIEWLGTETLDLTDESRFATPDDGNADDRTVLVVSLPNAVQPGETAQIRMEWRSKIPKTFARTGARGEYYFFAHWFPKLGVFEGERGWNCHQFHSTTEFFSDYGVYDVTMTVPESYELGATGRPLETTETADGQRSHRYHQADVHAFTWTTSPDYVVLERMFAREGLPTVAMRLMMQAEHLGQADRHFAATEAALESYGQWYGPYPYGHVTVVDPAWGSGAGGMEYPTLFTSGTRLFNPKGMDSPESVTIHEAGHQFWYGLVGNNEFEDAWIDEGFNTFSTIRTLETSFGPKVLSRRFVEPPGGGRGFFPLLFRDIELSRWDERRVRFRQSAESDIPDSHTFRYFPGTAGNISYSKTALWLATLERHLGWEVLQPILSTFFERYRYRHPDAADFIAVAEEVSGQDLSWFFDQVHYDHVAFDYAVHSISSVPAEPTGFIDGDPEPVYNEPEDDPDSGRWLSEVIVQRNGGGVFPVDVLLQFEDGEERRFQWDGSETWKAFTVTRESKLRRAVVDPDRVLMLDVNYSNNGRSVESRADLPAGKWSTRWLVWAQDLFTTFAYFI